MGNITSIRWLALGLLIAGAVGCASVPGASRSEVFRQPLEKMGLSSVFGPRGGRPHHGIDVPAPKGTEVFATAGGEIAFSGRQRGFGKVVIVRHAAGYESYYAHLSKISVREGRTVKRGQRVGKVGKTGNATGPHLHFEIRHHGRPINPMAVFGQSPQELAAD